MENLSGTNYKKQYLPDFLPVVFWAILLFFTEYAINQRRLKLFQNDEMIVIALYCKSFVNFFKGGIFSFEAGVCKPDHRIFHVFEKTYGKPAVFFDDLEKNIRSASEFGWNAVQFTGADMFRKTVNQLLS